VKLLEELGLVELELEAAAESLLELAFSDILSARLV
jgi:hypothetical protein